ncbi:hypothetical protein LXA43DRAFT_1017165 [Ganoderma leucocontextum]|nr:hypothetical protein LXA43DRAFT_1017165 [Ganoderma leucocontextum]
MAIKVWRSSLCFPSPSPPPASALPPLLRVRVFHPPNHHTTIRHSDPAIEPHMESPQHIPPPESPPKLNDDILLSVLYLYSSLQAATSMMATCRFLYHEGAKIILRDTRLPFDAGISEDKALSLLCFIQAENLSRCSYVRALCVAMQPMPDVIAQSLVDLLPHMTSLESLSLTIEHALESYPSLLSMFASLQTIKYIHVMDAGERGCELVQSLQSQLVSAHIYFTPINPDASRRLYSTAAFHPLILLQRSAPTLKTLTCGFWFDMDPRIIISLPKVTYPNMHTFTLYKCLCPSLSPFIRSFPSLAHLSVDTNLASRWERSRLAGIQWAIHFQMSPTGESLSWKQLHDYTGRLVDLWILGLSCPIRRLVLEDAPAARAPLALTDVLAYARPTDLTIAFRNSSLTDVLGADCLSALRTEGASGLRCLSLVFELTARDRELDVGRALADIEATVCTLKLARLGIEMYDVGLDGSEESENDSEESQDDSEESQDDSEESQDESEEESQDGSEEIQETADELESTFHNQPTAAFGADAHVYAHAETSGTTAAAPVPDGTPPASLSEPLSLGERTLDEIDVPALAERLIRSIPTLRDAFISMQQPRRCGTEVRAVRVLTPPPGTWLPVGYPVYRDREVAGEKESGRRSSEMSEPNE